MRKRPSLRRLVLTRYVMREVLGPTLLGLGTYTFLLMLRVVFSLAEQVFVHGLRFVDAGRLLLYALPHVVVLTLPMSFLFGVLIALGRLNADNEVTALQASGVSLGRVTGPVIVLGAVLMLANAGLTLGVGPETESRLTRLRVELLQRGEMMGQIQPRVFYDEFPGLLLYVRDVDRVSGYWRDVFLYERGRPGQENVIVASRGRLVSAGSSEDGSEASRKGGREDDAGGVKGGGVPWLLLEDVVTHRLNMRNPKSYSRDRNRVQLHQLTEDGGTGVATIEPGNGELNTRELMRRIAEMERTGAPSPTEEEKRAGELARLRVELHKRLAIPAACVAFALIGIPLGIGSRHGGRGRGLVISLGLISLYYVMLNHGELLAREGQIPAWVGVWAPNLVLGVVALPLLKRMGRWLGEARSSRRSWRAVWRRVRHVWPFSEFERREQQADARITGSIPLTVQRRRWRSHGPILLDRYVVRRLIGPLVAVLLSTITLFLIVDVADKIDEVAKHAASWGVFLAYYWNMIPQMVFDVTPLSFLIAVLVLLTMLEQRKELTVLKASGISIFRLTVPVLFVAACVAGLLFVLGDSVVPKANRKAHRYLDQIKGRDSSRRYTAGGRQWVFSRDGSTLYNFVRYDKQRQELVRLKLYKFNSSFGLGSMVFADRAVYRVGSWHAAAGWVRKFRSDGTDDFERYTMTRTLEVEERPTYFAQEYRPPSEMSFAKLHRYIETLRESGYKPTRLTVRWHGKITYPLTAFVMVLLGLPFGLSRGGGRHASPMVGIAMALGLGIAYLIVTALMAKMGEAGVVAPLVGAWTPPVLAVLVGINRLTTVRS